MDKAVDDINVEDIEKEIFRKLRIYLTKRLDLDQEGNIKRTAKNLNEVQKVKLLKNILLNDAYKTKVGKFIGEFNNVKILSDEYITEL